MAAFTRLVYRPQVRGCGCPEEDPAARQQALELQLAGLMLRHGELLAANEQLRNVNERLVVSCDRFYALYELSPTPYVTIDAGHVILELNRAAEELLGAPRARLLGRTIDELVGDADRGGFRAFVDEVFLDRGSRRRDVSLAREGVPPLAAQVEGVLLREDPVAPPRCVLAIVDITARKVAETTRRQDQNDALATVAHDLRGPLSTVGLACDALRDDLEPGDRRARVATIERSLVRCERLLKDLLGLTQLDRGALTLERASFDARDLVEEVVRDYRPTAVAGGATISTSVGETAQAIVGDRERLYHALSNLVRNALVHAPGAAIEIGLVTRGPDLVVTVTDDGPGIEPDQLPFVFEPYRRGTRRRGGTGLGLAIVKGVVEAHGGAISLTSRPGHGARFELRLPTAPPA